MVAALQDEAAAALPLIVVAFIVARGWHLTPGQAGAIDSGVAAMGALIVAPGDPLLQLGARRAGPFA
jgi:hypothetical protein